MNDVRTLNGLPSPAQKFYRDFVRERAVSHQLLAASRGTGRTTVAALIAAQALRKPGGGRVLILDESGEHGLHFQRIEEFQPTPHIHISVENRLLALGQFHRGKGVRFPRPLVCAVQPEAAARDEVLSALVSTSWDLVIAATDDERLTIAAESVLHRLRELKKVRRTLVMTTASVEASDYGEQLHLQSTVWPKSSRVLLKLVPYGRSQQELSVLKRLIALEELDGISNRARDLLEQAASSSLYALEDAALSMLEVFEVEPAPADLRMASSPPADELEYRALHKSFPAVSAFEHGEERLKDALFELLFALDNVDHDERLGTLADLVADSRSAERSLCIFCGFAVTAQYVVSALRDAGIGAAMATASNVVGEARDLVDANQVLVTTTAAAHLLDLHQYDEAISFDLHADPTEMSHRWAAFAGYQRKKPAPPMAVIVDPASPLLCEQEGLRRNGLVGNLAMRH